MPTVAELERLRALLERLTPLADVQRGELIRAQDWNIVVGALIELARAVVTQEREAAVPPHEHPDQVTTGWLDPRLRSLIERGPLADPAAVTRLQDVERKISTLSTQIERNGQEIKEVRDRATEVVTRDLVREADVTAVRRRIEGMADAREDVRALRETLRAVQTDLRTAIEVSRGLVIDGQPVNMAAILERLSSVEALRERLRLPSGQLLDAATLESRLTELTNTLVTEEELDEALANRPGQIPPDQVDALREELSTGLRAELQANHQSLTEQIRGEMNQRLSEVDARIAQAVADSLPGVRDSVLGSVRPEIAAAVQAVNTELRAFVETRLGEVSTSLRADLEGQLADVQRSIGPAILAELDRQIPPLIAPLQQGLEGLLARMQAAEARQTAHEGTLAGLAARMEAVAQQEANARAELQRSLLATMEGRLAGRDAQVEERFARESVATQERIEATIGSARPGLLEEARRQANAAAETRVREMAVQLRGEMHQIARDEIAGLEDRLNAGLAPMVNMILNERLPGMVRQQVQAVLEERLSTMVEEQIRSSFTELAPGLIAEQIRDILGEMLPGLVAEQVRAVRDAPAPRIR
ncbi:MAG TPA: hypothetical protein VNJ09_08835 [Chthonomonadales bacterium]|nr:hypothetical protein [Chthonomonadales bacterium]